MAKWKVDQWVLVKGTNKKFKFHIVEVITQTCNCGEQTIYAGRLFRNDGREEFLAPASKKEVFAEIELENL